MNLPSYLADVPDDAAPPRAANLEWYRRARYGLFVHYGLYSLEGRHEWLQFREKIPVADYAKLAERFTAENFDADAICQLAVDANMKYVNFVTRHHDSFALFATETTPFNSVTGAPARRDLVREMAHACEKHKLALFLYFSHGREWRHPHGVHNDTHGAAARPDYNPPEPSYAYGADHYLPIYLDYLTTQITELLTNYGPIAGIWLDGIMVPLSDKRKTPFPQPFNEPTNTLEWKLQDLYDHIHSLQPQVLVSYKQGVLGTEDYIAPEHKAIPSGGRHAGDGRPGEICTTMCDRPVVSWGYLEAGKGQHKTENEVWEALRRAAQGNLNLLLNTGPLPDGSLDGEDVEVLRRIGDRLRREGFPA